MLFHSAMLIAGLILLVFAGDYLVKGAVGLAENIGIPPLIIGLTIVAFGTSAPELVISLNSALSGLPDIATGNVIGSNIANVLLVMGLPALLSPLHAQQKGLARNVAIMLAFTLAFMWLISDGLITRLEGAGLFVGLLLFLLVQIVRARSAINDDETDDSPEDYIGEIGEAPHSTGMIAVFLIGGLIGLPIAAHMTVTGASFIASSFGVSQAVIGLTIVAIGTSLPELATTVSAAMRRETDVALGNIIGSNIFNIAAIMGVTGMVVNIPVAEVLISRDMWVMLAASVALAVICFARITTGKVIGTGMLIAYAVFLYMLF